jgi:glucose/arabinose dehydrogenase
MSLELPLRPVFAAIAVALGALGCGDIARQPVEAGMGPQPRLPEPRPERIPTVQVAKAVGGPAGAAPTPADGLAVTRLAEGLDHPRWLHVLPNGDVLVAETNAPPREEGGGLRGWAMKLVMKRAGAGTPSANRITLLRDADGDGVAETRSVFLDKLNSPFGMALVGNDLYVANADALLRYRYAPGAMRIDSAGAKVVDLPAAPRNHHWTKNVMASRDGRKLYVTVGSNSNVAEFGMEAEQGRAAIWEVDPGSGSHRIYASGLRNPNGMAWSGAGMLWTVVNERDELGSDLVPDYLTSVRDGAFYGWPYSWYGGHVDARVQPQRPDLVARAVVPDYALGPHTAALGLASAQGQQLGAAWSSGMFVGLHGSWNRKPPSGYKVVFVPFAGERPDGLPRDVLTGFLDAEGHARGRPVGVAIDARGALLVADDVGNIVWRVTAAAR